MPIASFFKKTFSVSASKIYALDALEWSGSLETEAQEKVKSKPSTYIKGQSLNTMSFEIPLRAGPLINVRSQIEQWEEIRDKMVPDYFILGTKPLGKNKWLLKSVTASDLLIDNTGFILSAKLALSFEEYVRAGTAKTATSSKASAKSSKAKASTNTKQSVDILPASYIDKTDNKRSNNNAASARLVTVEARLN